MSQSADNELQELIEGLIDDELTPEQSSQLAELIQSDEVARAQYLAHCRMHAALAWEHGSLGGMQEGELPVGEVFEKRPRSWNARDLRWTLSLSLVSGLALLVFIGWQILAPQLRIKAWESSPVIGEVNRQVGGELIIRSLGREMSVGDPLRTGDFEIFSGLAQLTLDNDIEIIIEAPARLRLESSKLLVLHEGKLSANVSPEGKGFTVETPDASVVDYGTEFGVEVDALDGSEVHVFNGSVEVTSLMDPRDPVRLQADQATRIGKGASGPSGVLVAPERFLRTLEEPTPSYSSTVRKLKPINYYRMSISDDGVTLLDRSGNDLHGQIHLNSREQTPFAPGKIGTGLHLKGSVFATVKQFPEVSNNQLTVMAWALAASRPRWANIATNQSSNETELFRLCLFKDHGGLSAKVRRTDGSMAQVQDPKPFPLGDWQHVAFVADGESLRLYRNGKEVARAPHQETEIPEGSLFGIGARIFEDRSTGGYNGVEFWDGKIDELSVFNQALTEEQLRQIYSSSFSG